MHNSFSVLVQIFQFYHALKKLTNNFCKLTYFYITDLGAGF